MLPNAKPLRKLAFRLVLVGALVAGGIALAEPGDSGKGGGGLIATQPADFLTLFLSGAGLPSSSVFSPFLSFF